MEVDRNGLEVLERDQCLRLLGSTTRGRVGFTSGALPTVLPVTFLLDGERILVLTERGGRLDAALHDVVVAFEVDEFDPVLDSGWSVAVTGFATEVRDPERLADPRLELGVQWPPVGDLAVIAISTEVVSGRRTPAKSRAATK